MTSKRKTKPNGATPMTQTTPVTPVTDVPVVETPVVVPTTVPEEPVVQMRVPRVQAGAQ